MPVAVKDEYDVAGYATTCGTRFRGRTAADADALSVARLRAAGAVIFGKTNMHELGMQPSGINPWHGTARNPYDPERDTGGSSSGSGACVGMGLVPVALGTDSGGSVRIPAAHNGVRRLEGHLRPRAARRHAGAVLVAGARRAAGGDGGRRAAHPRHHQRRAARAARPAAAAAHRHLRSLVAVGRCRAGGDRAGGVERVVGGEKVEIDLPHIELSLPVGSAIFTVEGAAALDQALAAGETLAASTRIALEFARGMSAVAFVKAQRARTLVVRDFEWAWENVDVIVTPTTAMTAPPYPRDALGSGELDEHKINQSVAFTFAQNLSGMPAVSVPCGYDTAGMPVGLQIIAPHGEDLRALAVAAAVEQVTVRHKPKIWCSPL